MLIFAYPRGEEELQDCVLLAYSGLEIHGKDQKPGPPSSGNLLHKYTWVAHHVSTEERRQVLDAENRVELECHCHSRDVPSLSLI